VAGSSNQNSGGKLAHPPRPPPPPPFGALLGQTDGQSHPKPRSLLPAPQTIPTPPASLHTHIGAPTGSTTLPLHDPSSLGKRKALGSVAAAAGDAHATPCLPVPLPQQEAAMSEADADTAAATPTTAALPQHQQHPHHASPPSPSHKRQRSMPAQPGIQYHHAPITRGGHDDAAGSRPGMTDVPPGPSARPSLPSPASAREAGAAQEAGAVQAGEGEAVRDILRQLVRDMGSITAASGQLCSHTWAGVQTSHGATPLPPSPSLGGHALPAVDVACAPARLLSLPQALKLHHSVQACMASLMQLTNLAVRSMTQHTGEQPQGTGVQPE
jgi:hypothetical protein